ncbi:MAG TPA: OsmC family protein [Prolixibacteraceae bacterium]|nr:OsmC family protein [Prolixibacteraceae bacterium]
MKQETNLVWKGDMAFESRINDHLIRIDASEEVGGHNTGMRPKTLMLTALAGCTGMDVISILKKMKIEPAEFNVRVVASVTEEHPKHYDGMHLIYEFRGENLPEDKLKKAIDLSQDKYCGVSAVYKKAMPVTYEIRIL